MTIWYPSRIPVPVARPSALFIMTELVHIRESVRRVLPNAPARVVNSCVKVLKGRWRCKATHKKEVPIDNKTYHIPAVPVEEADQFMPAWVGWALTALRDEARRRQEQAQQDIDRFAPPASAEDVEAVGDLPELVVDEADLAATF